MARPLRGTRYHDPASPASRELVWAVAEFLPFADLSEALEFYEIVVPTLDRREIALLGCNDRFFLLYALLGRRDLAHPWLYDRCREVEANPDGYLDLWAREHYKSTIITFGGIIQEVMSDPELTVGLFSYNQKSAEGFLAQIMREFETNERLRAVYSDVIWDRPRVEAPRWSLQAGIVLKRTSNPKEGTIEASGLVDGQKTGKHYGLLAYDDVVTLESVTTPEQVRKTTEAWEMSDNLGAGDVRKWHIGTRYCSIASMRITMSDWTQKPISEVRPGDFVVGWKQLPSGRRVLQPSRVLKIGAHPMQPVNKYTMVDGRSVTCTADHKWWRGARGNGPEYAPLTVPGKRNRRVDSVASIGNPDRPKGTKGLSFLCELLVPVERNDGRDAGWLAGMFDGEGTTKKNKNHPSGVPCIVQSMLNPEIIDETRSVLRRLKFEWSESWHYAADKDGNPRARMKHDRCVFLINGGWRERYRFLAEIGPSKTRDLSPTLFSYMQTQKIKLATVENAGTADVYWLETETGNYVIEGYCSSNSFADTWGQMMERGAVKPRIYPATDDGTLTGRLVLISPERWQEKIRTQRSTLAAQMLQNPLGGKENMFEAAWLRPWEIRPSVLNVYIMGDPSGGRKRDSDRTAIAVVGIGPTGKKYFLDGVCHRMPLSERWEWLKRLWLKWSRERGVQVIKVGWERYGLQADREYFMEKMREEQFSFEINELNWAQGGVGNQSKRARVERLEPDVRLGGLYLPGVLHKNAAEGDGTWRIGENGHIQITPFKKADGTVRYPKAMAEMIMAGTRNLVAHALKRVDEDGRVYDVTRILIDETIFFPYSPRDDLIDAVSRIYDMEPTSPDPRWSGVDESQINTFEDVA